MESCSKEIIILCTNGVLLYIFHDLPLCFGLVAHPPLSLSLPILRTFFGPFCLYAGPPANSQGIRPVPRVSAGLYAGPLRQPIRWTPPSAKLIQMESCSKEIFF